MNIRPCRSYNKRSRRALMKRSLREQYAAAKGFSVRFGNEGLRAMARSLFIQHGREGGDAREGCDDRGSLVDWNWHPDSS